MKRVMNFYEKFGMFLIPIFILAALIAGLVLQFAYGNKVTASVVYIIGIIPGAILLLMESITMLKNKSLALDYIAILALIVSFLSNEYLVGIILALMISSGNGLEKYAQKRAKSSLTALINRIPDEVLVWKSDTETRREKIESVRVGQSIFVRKGEVVPLDGILASDYGQLDESSLTGEAYPVDKRKGDKIRSGTTNMGSAIVVKVTHEDKDSTYRGIINMVKKAQSEKSPMIRLAHKYNGIFAVLTLAIAGGAYLYWHDLDKVLAVLAIATPCPLLIATPVALIGGMSSAAKKKIIVKNLEGIEALSKADTLVFDKTGTITLGKPVLKHINIVGRNYDKKQVLSIAEAIERNSLHPVAHSIVHEARREKVPSLTASKVEEKAGSQISGTIRNKRYTLLRGKESAQEDVHLMEGKKLIAEFIFDDVLKSDARNIIKKLEEMKMDVHVFTGDKERGAQRLKSAIDLDLDIQYDMSPADKQRGIKAFKRRGKTVAMIGDGINDAPALALADVGMVFSHAEHTASSEAADVVFLGGTFSEVYDSMNISRKTMKIAKQSMITGISLSVLGMFFAAGGLIVPIIGAILQEAIDVSVIINSLRSIRIKR